MTGLQNSRVSSGTTYEQGSRAMYRVGLVVPSANTVLEGEFFRRLPAWASLHTTRLYNVDADLAGLQIVHDEIPAATRIIATVRPQVVVVGCTAVTGIGHGEFEQLIVPRIAAATKASVVTVLPSTIEVLRRAGCRQVVLITPHGPEVDSVLIETLESNDIAVPETHSMNVEEAFGLGQVSVGAIEKFIAERVSRPLATQEAMFLSCTNFQSVEPLPRLRRKYGPNVFSSVQVVVEQTLAKLAKLHGVPAPESSGHAAALAGQTT